MNVVLENKDKTSNFSSAFYSHFEIIIKEIYRHRTKTIIVDEYLIIFIKSES